MTALGGPGMPVVIVDVGGNPVGVTTGSLNTSGGGGGGGAVTIADGADVTQGAKADSAYAGSGSASVVAALKGVYAALVAALPAGTNTIGNVGTKTVAPTAPTASAITTGGTATVLATGPWQGGFVQNPLSAGDQNIAAAENIYLNLVTTATANGRGTNICLYPGDSFNLPAVSNSVTLSAIAATTAHAVSIELFV